MSKPASKLAAIAIVCAASLLSLSPRLSAEERSSQFEAIGLEDAQPLPDSEMSQQRGAGFPTGLSAAIFNLLPQGRDALAPSAFGAGDPASFGGFLAALLRGLPAINLVAAELDDQPTVMLIGSAPQSLGCGSGITCPAGTTIYLSANNSLPPGSLSLDFTISH